jgi:uncharacterized RDD family membrane protein YckC
VVTPEAVEVTLDVAGPGSRMIAAIIDLAIQFAGGVVLALVLLAPSGGASSAVIVYSILGFALFWGYYPLFEGLWRGQTPGKRAQRLRVVQTDGQPAPWGPILLRNLVRIVDFLPAYYAVGIVTMLLNQRSQRLGDLAAGTMVVRERPLPSPTPLQLTSEVALQASAALDTTGVTEREYELVRQFLQRRWTLTVEARTRMASQLSAGLRHRCGPAVPGLPDEALLEAVAHAYRSRFASAGGGATPWNPAAPRPMPPRPDGGG